MGKVSREEKIEEAIKRMRIIGGYEETVRQFEKEGLLSVSEPPIGAFYWIEGEDRERIAKWEQENNALVYMVIRSYSNLGTMDSFLFVDDNKEDWVLEEEDLRARVPFVYVWNRDYPECSEYGSIKIKRTIAAGFVRIE